MGTSIPQIALVFKNKNRAIFTDGTARFKNEKVSRKIQMSEVGKWESGKVMAIP